MLEHLAAIMLQVSLMFCVLCLLYVRETLQNVVHIDRMKKYQIRQYVLCFIVLVYICCPWLHTYTHTCLYVRSCFDLKEISE